jgi:DNA-binding transcriptional ArsR family regulator
MVLREAGLVEVRRDGLNMFYHVTKPGIFDVLDAIFATTGKPRPHMAHRHGKGKDSCPCPKCNAEAAPRSTTVSAAR